MAEYLVRKAKSMVQKLQNLKTLLTQLMFTASPVADVVVLLGLVLVST